MDEIQERHEIILAFEGMEHLSKEEKAMERLRQGAERSLRYYEEPLLICYSGGKDSDCLLHLAIQSGINFEVVHSLTTADAPDTVYHVRKVFHELENKGIKCTVGLPMYKGKRTSMWNLIPQKKNAAYKDSPVLLFSLEGNKRRRKGLCDWRSVG